MNSERVEGSGMVDGSGSGASPQNRGLFEFQAGDDSGGAWIERGDRIFAIGINVGGAAVEDAID